MQFNKKLHSAFYMNKKIVPAQTINAEVKRMNNQNQNTPSQNNNQNPTSQNSNNKNNNCSNHGQNKKNQGQN